MSRDYDRSITPPYTPAQTNSELLEAWDAETQRVAVELMRERDGARPAFEVWGFSDITTYAKEVLKW